MTSDSWFLYALRCADDSLYTGVTTNVLRRLKEHNTGRGASYTAGRRPVTLIGAWPFPDRSAAQKAEARFRRLPRRMKLERIARQLPAAGSPFFQDGAIGEEIQPLRFCHRCGALVDWANRAGDDRPRQICTACDWIHYHNAKPCAGALVEQHGRLLLLQRAIEPYLGSWDIPGGFLEADEHPEAGAIREVREETGLNIELIELFGIYIDRYGYEDEGDHCLNIYYSARPVGGRAQPADEATDLAWFPPNQLPRTVAFHHARQVLRDWVNRKRPEPDGKRSRASC